MIDKEGEHAEIVINKKSEEKGAAITMVNVNMILLTTQKRVVFKTYLAET